MRNGQNKRMRGRNNRGGGGKSQNPLSRVFESNGPDVKVRGSAHHVAEKYVQLARDAQSSGDHVAAENYLQHAEHYLRIIATAQEQLNAQRQAFQRPEGEAREEDSSDNDDDMHPLDDRFSMPASAAPQNYISHQGPHSYSHAAQAYPPNQPQPNISAYPTPQRPPRPAYVENSDAPPSSELPSFITGGGAPSATGTEPQGEGGPADRFNRNRRRRRPERRPESEDASGYRVPESTLE